MTRADSIASHGRIGKVSALSIGSFGRLYRVVEIIARAATEIIHLISRINTTMSMESKINN